MFIGLVFSTHLLLNDSQQKQMDDRLVLFAATVAQSELIVLSYLHKENERSFGKFPFQLISIKYGLRTKTVDHGLALLSAHS